MTVLDELNRLTALPVGGVGALVRAVEFAEQFSADVSMITDTHRAQLRNGG